MIGVILLKICVLACNTGARPLHKLHCCNGLCNSTSAEKHSSPCFKAYVSSQTQAACVLATASTVQDSKEANTNLCWSIWSLLLSCTWGGASQAAAHDLHEQTGTCSHICICLLPPNPGTSQSAVRWLNCTAKHKAGSQSACTEWCCHTQQLNTLAQILVQMILMITWQSKSSYVYVSRCAVASSTSQLCSTALPCSCAPCTGSSLSLVALPGLLPS